MSGNTRQSFSIRSQLGQIYSSRLVYDTAEIWFRQVLDSLPASDPIVQSCLTSFVEQCITTERNVLADSLLNLLKKPISKPVDLMNEASLYQMKGMSDSAEFYINQAELSIKTPEQRVYYFEKLSWISELKGDFQTALEYKRKRLREQNVFVTSIFSKSVSDYQRNYELQQKELAEYRYIEYKRWSILIAIFCLFLVSGGIAYIIKKRKERQRIIDNYMENVSDLQRTLLENTDTITMLQHKVDTIDTEHLAKEEKYRNQIKTLFAKSFQEFDSLYKEYYDCEGVPGMQRRIYQNVRNRIEAFANASQQGELDRLIDDNFDHAHEKAKSPEIGLSEKELQLFKYKLAGLSSRTIRLLMHIDSRDALQKRQQRLRKKILESNSPFATELASLMD